MDAQADGPVSRPPTLEDIVALCRSLNAEGVRYVVIGGIAVILHGFVRATKDLDLLVEPSRTNLEALRKAMSCLPDNAIAAVEDGDLDRYQVVRVADEIVVDLMASACGVRYEDAVREGVESVEIDGVIIPLASKKVLLRTKDTVRPCDRMDSDFLRARIEEDGKV